MIAVQGRIQREGDVVHLVANQLADLSADLAGVGDRGAGFPLPHGRGERRVRSDGGGDRDPGDGAVGTGSFFVVKCASIHDSAAPSLVFAFDSSPEISPGIASKSAKIGETTLLAPTAPVVSTEVTSWIRGRCVTERHENPQVPR